MRVVLTGSRHMQPVGLDTAAFHEPYPQLPYSPSKQGEEAGRVGETLRYMKQY